MFAQLTTIRRQFTCNLFFKWAIGVACIRLMLFGWFILSTNALFAQNSSLFHRPVAHLAQAGQQGVQGEVLPAPGPFVQMQPNTQMQPNNGPPQFLSNPLAGAYVPSQMENASHLGLQSSWGYVAPVPARALKLHDIVSIRIEELTTSLATGNATSRKTTSLDAVLKDWVRLVGIDTIKPDVQSNGDQRVKIEENEVYRGDSTIRSSEAFTSNIAAEIVDIKPNGLIVLDATKDITINDNSWRVSLTGTCRSQDIGPDNVILSRNLIRSHINKQDLGHVRDGYSRGWLTKFYARIKPF